MKPQPMIRRLCDEVAERAGATPRNSEIVAARFNDAADNGRVKYSYLALASSTKYSNPARDEYSFTFGLWWFPHRTMRDKVRHELGHHFVALEIQQRTGRDVFLEERLGLLPLEDDQKIERRVRGISDPTDPVRKAMCTLEWWSLVEAYWASRHPVASGIIGTVVAGAAVVALITMC